MTIIKLKKMGQLTAVFIGDTMIYSTAVTPYYAKLHIEILLKQFNVVNFEVEIV